MSPGIIIVIILGIVLIIPLIWLILTYNNLVSLRNHLKESQSDIQVELKRRFELIPNLVETVKAYAAHEQELLTKVTSLRNSSNIGFEENGTERQLLSGVKRLFGLAENYPDLKADDQFLHLQEELVITEDRLAAARRFYNGNVRDYRNAREHFPSSLVAGMFKFPSVDLLTAPEEVSHVPRVSKR